MVENKEFLITQKLNTFKKADAFAAPLIMKEEIGAAEKANKPLNEDIGSLKVKVVINTTNLMDGHQDVHLPGLWSKSLKENKRLMHMQEHEMKFDHIISDRTDLKAYTETMTWKELGYNYPGTTEALIFESTVRQSRNKYMFNEYKAGRVDNHSVGMRYVKIDLAVNDKNWPEEKKVWDKYIDQVANRKEAEDLGFLWFVHEAKAVEGSAVPVGSNWITPTLENNMKSEPGEPTPQEPDKSTQLTSEEIIIRINKHFNN